MILLFLLRIVKIAFGILNLAVSAKYFGVSVDRDVWILAFNGMIILDMALWGSVNETFRAKFIAVKEHSGEAIALRHTKSLLLFTTIFSALFVMMVMCFPQLVAKLIAPSYKGEQLAALLQMLVYVAPCFLINQMIQIGISLLNAYESFYIPEIASFMTVVINLLLIIFLAPLMGIYALLVAYYLGVLILLLLVVLQIRKLNICLFSWDKELKWNDFLIFILFAIPFFFPYFLGQISAIVEKNMASTMSAGTVSILDYSRKFSEIFISVLSGVLTTILVPLLSLKFAQRKARDFMKDFVTVYQLGFLVVIGMVAMFTSCPYAFADVLYNKGSISSASLAEISRLITLYSWTALPIFLYLIFGLVLLSAGRGKVYAFWGIIAQCMVLAGNLVFVQWLGMYVFPISVFIAHLLTGIVLLFKFPFKNKQLWVVTLKNVLILLITTSILYALNQASAAMLPSIWRIAMSFLILVPVMLAQGFILKLDERYILMDYVNRILKR